MTSSFNWGLPEAASTFAPEIDFGIKLLHWAMLIIFVLWGIFFTYLLIRYRKRPGVSVEAAEGGVWKSLLPDGFILVFELALIFFYAIPVWARIKTILPKSEESNVVAVIAEQFVWNIQYPGPDKKFGRKDLKFIDSGNVLGLDPEDPDGKDDITTLNELHVPLARPTLMHLTSKDVIHSFFVPAFRVKTDIMPGLKIPLWFEPTHVGKYEITCSQLCGIGHSGMRGDVIVHTPEDFKSWLAAQAAEKKANQ